MGKTYLDLEKIWYRIKNEPTVWDFLRIKDRSFYFNYKSKQLFLSSFKLKNLPDPPYKLKFLGQILIKASHFANIMARCPGTEEVTFYALLNTPQKGIFGRILDKKMLSIAAPPLTWRREQIRKAISSKIESYTKQKQSFLFLDIGCGAGFDSLEIERIMHRLEILTGRAEYSDSYASFNIDIDNTWLNNNQMLAEELYGDNCNITRETISAFEFLYRDSSHSILNQYDNLIVSCNGFAEFLTYRDLLKLYQGIHGLANNFVGGIYIILPFANKNEKQESLGDKIGFQFRAQDKNELIAMVKKIFKEQTVSYTVKYSQTVLIIEG